METRSHLVHPNVAVSPIGRRKTGKLFIGVVSSLVTKVRYCCFSGQSIDNAYSAVMERVFYHSDGHGGFILPYVPIKATVDHYLRRFTVLFGSLSRETVPVPLRIYPERNYWGRRLKLYQKARDNVVGRTYGPEMANVKAFVKVEKILMKDKRIVPRLIQPRSPEYNVSVGRYIRQLEHTIYSNIDTLLGGPSVMKGRNCYQQGKAFIEAWSGFSNPVAIMLDAVRFDQHVSVPMLQWEHERYLQFFPPMYARSLGKLLSMQLSNRGTISCADGFIRYTTKGGRASGDMNTSMGNVLIMCGIIHSWFAMHGFRCGDYRLMNNGDDCCLIVEARDIHRVLEPSDGFPLTRFFRDLGFLIEIEPITRVIEGISFCQTHPVFDGVSWRMVRDPRSGISKDLTILRNWSSLEYNTYLFELGKCGLSCTEGIPIWAAFYRCLMRSECARASVGMRRHVTQGLSDTGLGRLASGVREKKINKISDRARVSFALAFGITPDVQRHVEAFYDKCSPGTRELFVGPVAGILF